MIIDNPVGLQYLFNDDIYLLQKEMNSLEAVVTEHVTTIDEPIVILQQTIATEAPVPVITQPIVAEPAPLYFNHLGKNAKQFLILCCYPDLEQMDEKHLTALTSALQRKELALDDVAILNISKYSTASVTELSGYFKPSRLLLLGAPALLSGWDKLSLNQLQNLGGIKMLYTYSFGEMMGDRDKTKAFWEQMKVL